MSSWWSTMFSRAFVSGNSADPCSSSAVSLDDEARVELRQLADQQRLRVPRIVDGACGPTVRVDGVEVINASSNDYLSLASDRRLVDAAKATLDEVGVGAGASRLITGTQRAHVALERAAAE